MVTGSAACALDSASPSARPVTKTKFRFMDNSKLKKTLPT
jgi:hypothetical protein